MDSSRLITIIGRGNSGTRILSYCFLASGIHMGHCLNERGDKYPSDHLWRAIRIFNRRLRYREKHGWNFRDFQANKIPFDFMKELTLYLDDVLRPHEPSPSGMYGWKCPETLFVLPWLARIFPEMKYVFIERKPETSLKSFHLSDDLSRWNVPYPQAKTLMGQRVWSWAYQAAVVAETPRPKNSITIRYEDLVMNHQREMKRLESFVGVKLARLPMNLARFENRKPLDLSRYKKLLSLPETRVRQDGR